MQKLLHGLGSQSGRLALKKGVAASIEHSVALDGRQYNTVVDVGGNVGQFALFAREKYPHARVFSFEPLEDCWNTFASIFDQDERVQLFRCGIGTEDTEVVINVANANDSSSILPPAAMQIEAFGTTVSATKDIQLRRLASVLRTDQIIAPALLKIDVQGFELDVLKGSKELLSLFETVYVEASYVELYQGQALAGDVLEFMREHGFEIQGVYNQYQHHIKGALQADFLFKRRSTPQHAKN
ncbi:hypothetical protein TSA1_32195 [Bradyrhizobium nitroreducens]|uniref:Methyltransferase FkbM domain-containing protein n=1 Tax=Bradyrhizobium nitroreducens TaxID=709803 RepID=A0A2M6UPH4_9BRAD|nr:hypothetical protein TSA1_32195 [Bradyrhizobium nitroreducens]